MVKRRHSLNFKKATRQSQKATSLVLKTKRLNFRKRELCSYNNCWWQCVLTHPNMAKLILTIFISFILTQAFGQFKPKGTFIGLIPMKGYGDPAKPQYKWYHLSELTFKGDSVFLEQSPVAIFKKDTVFSASDGGFYSYRGTFETYKGKTAASLTLINCDYCPMQMLQFTPPKIINDIDTSTVATTDTSTVNEPKQIENSRLKYKTYFLEKAKSDREILVNKIAFRRRKA